MKSWVIRRQLKWLSRVKIYFFNLQREEMPALQMLCPLHLQLNVQEWEWGLEKYQDSSGLQDHLVYRSFAKKILTPDDKKKIKKHAKYS